MRRSMAIALLTVGTCCVSLSCRPTALVFSGGPECPTEVHVAAVSWDVEVVAAPTVLAVAAGAGSVRDTARDPDYLCHWRDLLNNHSSRPHVLRAIDPRVVLSFSYCSGRHDTVAFGYDLMAVNGVVYPLDVDLLRIAVSRLPERMRARVDRYLEQHPDEN